MFDELRMALAELALSWALSIAPDNEEGARLALALHRYFSEASQEAPPMIIAFLSSLICASAGLALMLRDIHRERAGAAWAERANAFNRAVKEARRTRKMTGDLKRSVSYHIGPRVLGCGVTLELYGVDLAAEARKSDAL